MTLCEVEKLRSEERKKSDEEFEKFLKCVFKEYDEKKYERQWSYLKSMNGLNLMYVDRK